MALATVQADQGFGFHRAGVGFQNVFQGQHVLTAQAVRRNLHADRRVALAAGFCQGPHALAQELEFARGVLGIFLIGILGGVALAVQASRQTEGLAQPGSAPGPRHRSAGKKSLPRGR